jgi:hypothetical protein
VPSTVLGTLPRPWYRTSPVRNPSASDPLTVTRNVPSGNLVLASSDRPLDEEARRRAERARNRDAKDVS